MRESILSHLLDPLKETLYNRSMIIERERAEGGLKFAGLSCDLLPGEILNAMGVVPLMKGPEENEMESFDYLISPEIDSGYRGLNKMSFRPPAGWAAYAAGELRLKLDALVISMGLPSLQEIDEGRLREKAVLYNTLRRTVRGIHGARKRNPRILSNSDMFALYEGAGGLPPERVLMLTAPLYSAAMEFSETSEEFSVSALVSGGSLKDLSLLDTIEENGVIVSEDHFCGGRRMFDISYNAEAPDILSEIIYAFTFKLYCHTIRACSERYELFYRMLKQHGIETVFFIEGSGEHCPSPEDIDFFSKKLMRGGVDPVICNEDSASEAAGEYAELSVKRLG